MRKFSLIAVVRYFVLLLCLCGGAIAIFAQEPKTTANSVSQCLAEAQQSRERGDWAAAMQWLTRALDQDARQREARQMLIQILLQQGQLAAAESHLQTLAGYFPNAAETQYLRGLIALQQGQPARALELAEQCLQRNPPESASAHKLAGLSAYLLQQFETFERHMREAARLQPLDAEPFYHLGRYYFEDKRYVDALRAFKNVIQLDARHYKARYYTALVYEGQNEMTQAQAELQAAIRLIEQQRVAYAWPYVDLGRLLVNEGALERGLSWLYRGVRNDPASPYAHYHYAKALFQQSASFEVKAELDEALKLDPGYSDAWYLLARYYQKTGATKLAQETFTRFEEVKKRSAPSPYGVRRQ